MEIEVTLFSILRENRFAKKTLVLETKATVRTVLGDLQIDTQEIESVFVNGKTATFDRQLVDGDRLTLLPLIGGG